MPTKYEVTDQGVKSRLTEIVGRVSDLSPVMREIAGDLHDSIEESFAREADPITRQPWRRLSEEHQAYREEHGYWPGKILQMTGLMAASVQEGFDASSAWAGTNRRQARNHNEGITVPQRRFIGLWAERRARIIHRLAKYVTG